MEQTIIRCRLCTNGSQYWVVTTTDQYALGVSERVDNQQDAEDLLVRIRGLSPDVVRLPDQIVARRAP